MTDAVSAAPPQIDAGIERPSPSAGNSYFGSDAVADTLRALDIPFVALTPGASFRGLHDSLVNHLGNAAPKMLLCLHEEHAVAIGQGWAKVTGRAMAAIVHSNVGLMHATMAFFNAWCDRMPVLVLGATGPVDAAKRRPWIDWIHTSRDQGALVRPYVKWDDQPASAAAAREALLRGTWLANTAPMGPVYINLDAEMQETQLSEPLPPIDPARYMPPVAAGAPAQLVEQAAAKLHGARKVVILAGRVSRREDAWEQRIRLAERLGAWVATDSKIGAAFPTDHPLHVAPYGHFLDPAAAAAMREADVVLSLDWVDLAGTIKTVFGGKAPGAEIIQVSLDHTIHNGWSMDHQGLPPVDLLLAADPDEVVPSLLAALPGEDRPVWTIESRPPAPPASAPAPGVFRVEDLASVLRKAVGDRMVSLLHLPLSWNGTWWDFRHPLDYVGSDGGGGIGGGPGIAVGSALALKGSGRLPVAICGDGDFLMGVTAVWTAVHYRIPMLFVIANNRSYFNDELHQERVARIRDRPVENRWIGQHIGEPDVDLAQISAAQGAEGFGPVDSEESLALALQQALGVVERGGVAVVDVRVATGYSASMASALTRSDNGEGGKNG